LQAIYSHFHFILDVELRAVFFFYRGNSRKADLSEVGYGGQPVIPLRSFRGFRDFLRNTALKEISNLWKKQKKLQRNRTKGLLYAF